MEIHHNPSTAKNMVGQFAFLHMVLILWPIYPVASGGYAIIAQPGCGSFCGSVEIPYPFGMKNASCYMDKWFEIECSARNNCGYEIECSARNNCCYENIEKPFLKYINLEVTKIDANNGFVWIENPISRWNCTRKNAEPTINMKGGPFVYSHRDNKFLAVGSNKTVLVQSNDSKVGGWTSICDENEEAKIGLESSCHGRNCCESSLPMYLSEYRAKVNGGPKKASTDECTYAMIAAGHYFFRSDLKDLDYVPAVLEWEVFNSSIVGNRNADCYDTNITSSQKEHSGRRCQCRPGFYGNPYVSGGCRDGAKGYEKPKVRPTWTMVGVTTGGFALHFVLQKIYKILRRGLKQKSKEKNFRQNGGLLLRQQRLSFGKVNFDKRKLFNVKDLEQATDRFNVNRVLGKGGQGTVYKGMLTDGQIVAIKKFKVEENVEGFINDVLILSQINHRNVVKLLGFCLENEVPLLVYEFVPNGNLFQYLHDQNEDIPMTWQMRLRIATEIAGALYYLHSAASQPLYHRDIKSTNILLDKKYRAKVANFGTYRMVTIEDIHLTTLDQGTFGYLDPEYFHTGQFTEKSDVYSFGVILVELLTGQNPISYSSSSTRHEEAKSLVSYFIMSLEEDRLFDILDRRIMEGEKEDIMAVAKLAKKCLELNGRERPTIKEATMELKGIQKLGNMSNIVEQYQEEIEDVGIEAYQTLAEDSLSSTVLSFLSDISGCG